MRAPIGLPAFFRGFGTPRPLLAETDGLQTFGGDTERLDEFACGSGPAITESEVVLRRTTLIAVAFESDDRGREVRKDRKQRLSVLRQSGPGIGTDTGLVV